MGMEGRGQNAVGGVLRHFMVVELERGVVRKVEERWVGVWRGSHEGGGPEARPVTSKTLLRLVSAAPIEEQSGSRLGGVGDMLGQQEGEMALEYEVFDGYEVSAGAFCVAATGTAQVQSRRISWKLRHDVWREDCILVVGTAADAPCQSEGVCGSQRGRGDGGGELVVRRHAAGVDRFGATAEAGQGSGQR